MASAEQCASSHAQIASFNSSQAFLVPQPIAEIKAFFMGSSSVVDAR